MPRQCEKFTYLPVLVSILCPRCEGAAARLALIILAATVLLAAPPGGQRATLERITYHETLPNGLEVIVVENHSVRDRMTALCVTGDRGESQRLRPRRPGTLASIS